MKVLPSCWASPLASISRCAYEAGYLFHIRFGCNLCKYACRWQTCWYCEIVGGYRGDDDGVLQMADDDGGDAEGQDPAPHSSPAKYQNSDFFDELSCEALERLKLAEAAGEGGRPVFDGRARAAEQRKVRHFTTRPDFRQYVQNVGCTSARCAVSRVHHAYGKHCLGFCAKRGMLMRHQQRC